MIRYPFRKYLIKKGKSYILKENHPGTIIEEELLIRLVRFSIFLIY